MVPRRFAGGDSVAEKSGSESPPTISLSWVEKNKAAYKNVTRDGEPDLPKSGEGVIIVTAIE